eukprot:m.230655 g.230655  ORF g.230655 m.230655 type:complete len:242 (-) comp18115_c0_seq1:89-814(-)
MATSAALPVLVLLAVLILLSIALAQSCWTQIPLLSGVTAETGMVSHCIGGACASWSHCDASKNTCIVRWISFGSLITALISNTINLLHVLSYARSPHGHLRQQVACLRQCTSISFFSLLCLMICLGLWALFSHMYHQDLNANKWSLCLGYWLALSAFPLAFFLAYTSRRMWLELSEEFSYERVPLHPADRSYMDLMHGDTLRVETTQVPMGWPQPTTGDAPPPYSVALAAGSPPAYQASKF